MNIAILYGSVRADRQGINAAKFIKQKLDDRNHEASIIDPLEFPLPFLDKMHKEYPSGKAPKMMETIHDILLKADGFVIVAGEYNHSIPPALKNMIDHFQSEYFFKPSAIVSYSAGTFGGVRVAVHLRAVLAELGMSSIPSTFPVSKIQDAFDEEGKAVDKVYDRRVVRFLDEFEWYLRALKNERDLATS